MSSRCHAAAGFLFALLCLACGGSDGGAGNAPGGEGDRGDPVWGEARPVEEVVIGRAEGPDEYLFGNVGGLAQHPDGTVFIVDSQAPVIRRYDAEGNWLHDVGRIDDPSELRPGESPPFVLERYGPDGEPAGRVELPSDDPETSGFVLRSRQGDLRNFPLAEQWAFSPRGYLIVGHTGEYAFEMRRGDDVLHRFEHDWEPVPLHPEEREEWQAWIEFVRERARSSDRQPTDFAPIPETKPAFMEVRAGEDGSIWVSRYAEAVERDGRPPREPDDPRPQLVWWQYPTWDAFDEEGRFLGTVELPHDTYVLEFHRDHLWCVRPDAADEDQVVRYRIEKTGG